MECGLGTKNYYSI